MIKQIDKTVINTDINILMYLEQCVKFLATNRDVKMSTADVSKTFQDGMRVVNTLNANIYNQVIQENLQSTFTLIHMANEKNIPYMLTTPWFVFDSLTLRKMDSKLVAGIQSMPEYNDKIIMDMTRLVRLSKNQPTRLSDIMEFQSLIVRSVLNRSYYTFSDIWLSSIIVFYLAKVYGTIMSSKIARVYNLNMKEQMTIAVVFMIYMIYVCTSDEEPSSRLLNKDPSLQRMVDVKSVVSAVTSYYNEFKRFGLQGVVDVIKELSPARVDDLNLSSLFKLGLNLSTDHLISMTSIEFPPFFLSILLDAISGSKTSMYHDIKNLGIKRDVVSLGTELVKSSSLTQSLKR